MQRKGPFPSLQLIFLQKPVRAMKMLLLASPNYTKLVWPDFFLGLSAIETGERTELCCVAGARHILLQHFPGAAKWFCQNKTSVSLHMNLRGVWLFLGPSFPKAVFGNYLTKSPVLVMQFWWDEAGATVATEISVFWWVVFVSLE